jgi:sulfotransferase famil protein
MRRDQLPLHPSATYVMPQYKAMYVSVNKAACTSLKWLVADVQEESPERFARSLSRELTRTMTVHRRNLWKHTPRARDLTDDELAAIDPQGDWFVFAVVRHPTARLFSAWQSKLLLREGWWVEEFGTEPWFPRIPRSTADVVDDFRGFVQAAQDDPEHRILRNRHFASQPWMLATDRMDYTRIYRTTEIPQLLTDFERHLRANGWDGEPLELRRANETPLKPIPALFGPDVLAIVQEMFAADFATFGYDDPMPGGLDPSDTYSDSQLAEVERLIERAERINDLATRSQTLARQLKRAERRAAQATPAPRHSALRRWLWRAKQRLTGARRPSAPQQLANGVQDGAQNGLQRVRQPAPDGKSRPKQPTG